MIKKCKYIIFKFYIKHISFSCRMKVQRHKQNSQRSKPRMESVIIGIEFILYLATLIFSTAFGLFVSSFITIKRPKENGYLAFVLDKIVCYIIKAPIFGFISILTFPSSLFAFIIWTLLSKCKYKSMNVFKINLVFIFVIFCYILFLFLLKIAMGNLYCMYLLTTLRLPTK